MTAQSPRVAIVGAGPSGLYAANALLGGNEDVRIDILDRLPTPYGLLRYGVAPDHTSMQGIQRVLAEHQGNISATARALGMHRRTLPRKSQKRPVRR